MLEEERGKRGGAEGCVVLSKIDKAEVQLLDVNCEMGGQQQTLLMWA